MGRRVTKPLVLVAEHDPFQLELFQEACEAAGFEVTGALDGQRVLAQIARHPPSIVLLSDELVNPVASEVVDILRADQELGNLPILAIGGGIPASDVHIERPVRLERLQSVLWRLLRRARDARRRLRTESAPRLALELDEVTGAGTRGQMEITLHRELLIAARFRRPLGVMRVKVSDAQSLPQVAKRMMDVLRGTDLVFRLSLLELIAVLPETELHEGAVARQRLRVALTADERIDWVGIASVESAGDVNALLLAAQQEGQATAGA